jgi:hypothetical protein
MGDIEPLCCFAVIKKQLLFAVKLGCLGRCGLKSKPKWISSNVLDLICQLRFSTIWMTLVTSFVCLLFLDLGPDLVIHLISKLALLVVYNVNLLYA